MSALIQDAMLSSPAVQRHGAVSQTLVWSEAQADARALGHRIDCVACSAAHWGLQTRRRSQEVRSSRTSCGMASLQFRRSWSPQPASPSC